MGCYVAYGLCRVCPAPRISDEMYDTTFHVVTEHPHASISWLQCRLRVGYNGAARMAARRSICGACSTSSGKEDVVEARLELGLLEDAAPLGERAGNDHELAGAAEALERAS